VLRSELGGQHPVVHGIRLQYAHSQRYEDKQYEGAADGHRYGGGAEPHFSAAVARRLAQA